MLIRNWRVITPESRGEWRLRDISLVLGVP